MEITLKKAVELQNRIGHAISELTTKVAEAGSSQFTQYNYGTMEARRAEAMATLDRAEALVEARFFLRDLVAATNERVGVNKLLNQIAKEGALMATIDSFDSPYGRAQTMTEDELKKHFESAVAAQKSFGNDVRPVAANILPVEDFKRLQKERQLKISQLRDDLAVLNLTTKVDISQVAQVLKDEFIL